MGFFLVAAGIWTFFAPVTLEKAQDICEPDPITKECYVEALQPITTVDYEKLNN